MTLFDTSGKNCPTAYGGCTCHCHSMEGVKHCMPCCYPSDDENYGGWDSDEVEQVEDFHEFKIVDKEKEKDDSLVERLESLLPGMEFNKQVHMNWRDCDQSCRDRNPEIGDVQFHGKHVKRYAKQIEVITETIKFLQGERQHGR